MSKKKSPPQPSQKSPPEISETGNSKLEIGNSEILDNFWFLVGILVAATVATYFSSLSNGFMVFDDDKAIRYNQIIKNPSFTGIFGANNLGMYAPVTWLGYALVYKLAGESASAFHVFSLILHLGSVLAVFWLVDLMVKKREIAFFTALLFALHPMQVEATCWIAGQSAVTFSFFYLLGLVAYVKWLDGNRPLFYALTFLAFIFSVLAKSAAVTFPLMLLALDWYFSGEVKLKNVLGKLPFFAASLAFGFYTFLTRQAEGHDLVVATKKFGIFDRFLMVCHSLLFYPVKLLIPSGLSIFYPMEKTGGTWRFDYYLAPIAVAALAWLIWKTAQKTREIGLAGLWYFLPLVVMLPYVSVGTFEMRSDRYIYISSAGFFFGLVWLAQRLEPKIRLGLLSGAAIVFAILTFNHSKVWKNEVSAFQNCVEKYPDAPLCNCNLAYGELLNLDFENCVKHYTKTLQLDPTYVEAYNGRGQAFFELKKFSEAFSDFDNAIKAGIVTPKLFLNRGKCHVILNRPGEAIPDLQKSAELEPRNPETFYFKGVAENKVGQPDAAIKSYSKAIELRPDYVEALVNRGLIYFGANRLDEAIGDYSAALQVNGNIPLALHNRAAAFMAQGKYAMALEDANKAIAAMPNNLKFYETRAKIFTSMGRAAEAAADLAKLGGK